MVRITVIGLVMLCTLFGCQKPETKVQSLQAVASSNSLEMFATLSVGEFDMKVAPLNTKLAKHVHDVRLKLQKGAIGVEKAQEENARIDTLRVQLQKAEDICKPDKHTGKCTGNTKEADVLIQQVRELADSLGS